VYTCDGQPAITGLPRYDEFVAKDTNQDGDWYYYRNGSFLGFYGLGTFTLGQLRANSERKSGHHDSMYAHFQGLDRMTTGGGWANWLGTTQIEDSDADYRLCVRAADTLQIQTGPC
jgi:hypothetical protein